MTVKNEQHDGVRREEAVLMRMNSVPRRVAATLGQALSTRTGIASERIRAQEARPFLQDLDASGWERVRPRGAHLSGADYKIIWGLLSGEQK
ncbi:hypothetical protein NKDENANG_01502 [Candidatus Entotheonellaceae bacterium PAL068K]